MHLMEASYGFFWDALEVRYACLFLKQFNKILIAYYVLRTVQLILWETEYWAWWTNLGWLLLCSYSVRRKDYRTRSMYQAKTYKVWVYQGHCLFDLHSSGQEGLSHAFLLSEPHNYKTIIDQLYLRCTES